MKKTLLIATLTVLAGCSSTGSDVQEYTYILMKSGNIPVSTHQTYNDCKAASIRENIRITNAWNSKHKPYQRVPIQEGSKKIAVCQKA